MANYSYNQLYQLAGQTGFTGLSQYVIAAIAMAESSGDPLAKNCNNPGGTCDRGILQINNYYHPEVSDACAYNPTCAFQAGFRISAGGSNFSQWVTYIDGKYKQFLPSGVGGTGSGNNQGTPLSGNVAGDSTCTPPGWCYLIPFYAVIPACQCGAPPLNPPPQITQQQQQFGATVDFLTNPIRLFKFVFGVVLMLGAVFVTFLPDISAAAITAAGFPEAAGAVRTSAGAVKKGLAIAGAVGEQRTLRRTRAQAAIAQRRYDQRENEARRQQAVGNFANLVGAQGQRPPPMGATRRRTNRRGQQRQQAAQPQQLTPPNMENVGGYYQHQATGPSGKIDIKRTDDPEQTPDYGKS